MEIGRAAGGELRDDGRVRWAIGNSPIDFFNCVAFADLDAEEADGEITASIERMRAHDVPGSWHVGPLMRPRDLGARLLAHGFEYGGDDAGMAVDLQELPEDIAVPSDFAVERIRDEAGLGEWSATFGLGFGIGPVEAGWMEEMFRKLGTGRSVASLPRAAGRRARGHVSVVLRGRRRGGLLRLHHRERQEAGHRGCRDARCAAGSRGISATASPSSLLPRWVTPSTANSASSNTAGSASTNGANDRTVTVPDVCVHDPPNAPRKLRDCPKNSRHRVAKLTAISI